MLIGKYIPNLFAKLFEVSREYVQLIYDQKKTGLEVHNVKNLLISSSSSFSRTNLLLPSDVLKLRIGYSTSLHSSD
jgi:hypothetical protein